MVKGIESNNKSNFIEIDKKFYLILNDTIAEELFKNKVVGNPVCVKKAVNSNITKPLVLYSHEMVVISGEPKNLREKVFLDLIKKGFIVRSGLKYGTDFAVYREKPGLEHAPFLVKVCSSDTRLKGFEIVGNSRLSHSVRKSFIIATEYENKIWYIRFEWFRP